MTFWHVSCYHDCTALPCVYVSQDPFPELNPCNLGVDVCPLGFLITGLFLGQSKNSTQEHLGSGQNCQLLSSDSRAVILKPFHVSYEPLFDKNFDLDFIIEKTKKNKKQPSHISCRTLAFLPQSNNYMEVIKMYWLQLQNCHSCFSQFLFPSLSVMNAIIALPFGGQ